MDRLNKKMQIKKTAAGTALAILVFLFFLWSLNVSAYADDIKPIETMDDESSVQTFSTSASVNNISKYGNVVLSLKCEEILGAGYEYGDVLLVCFLDHSLELPLCSNFTDVDSGSPGIFAKEGSEYVLLAVNMGDFATSYGIAEKIVDKEGNVSWIPVSDPKIPVTVSMKEKGGYYNEYLLHQLKYEDDRSAYPMLSDEQFANFREVTTTGMGHGILYRSASPINPVHSRNKYADEAIRKAGVNVIMNLADDEATAKSYEGFENSYYSGQNFIALNLGVDFSSEDFREMLAKGLRFFALNPGIYEVHCTEGKDRAGFVSAILECLMGAGYDEIISDYMVTFYNYYGVTEGDEKYQVIADSNIVKSLKNAFGVEDLESADLAAEAAEYLQQIGLSDEEISLLKTNLGRSKPDNNDPEKDKAEEVIRVPVTGSGSEYASSKDNFAPVVTSGKISSLKLDFSNVAKSEVKPSDLRMTAIKGSKFTLTEALLTKDSFKKSGGIKVKVNKKTLIAKVSCTSDGTAEFTLRNGAAYIITFTVQKPKANDALKQLSIGGPEEKLTVKELFGTDIDAGELYIVKQKHGNALVSDKTLTVNPKEKDRIKLIYKYHNKKYKMTIKVK